MQWVAVGLGQVLLYGQVRILPKVEFVKSTGLDLATKIVLVITGEDDDLSTLGEDPVALTTAVAAAGYDLVLAPAFSAWDGHSGLHNRLQIVYCDRYATTLAGAQVATIYPAVWYRRADMHDLARAVQANPSIGLVWLDWQTVSRGQAWERVLRELDEVASLVPGVGFIINGVGERRTALWEREYVACVISSGELVGAVNQNRGSDGVALARARILDFVAEPQRYASS